RFDVFGLIDAALAGQAGHALRMLEGLRGEGVEAPVILWALARETRQLANLSFQHEQGVPLERAFAQCRPPVWDKRRPLVSRALQRHGAGRWGQLLRDAQQIDAQIKGQAAGDPWAGLASLTLHIARVRLPPPRRPLPPPGPLDMRRTTRRVRPPAAGARGEDSMATSQSKRPSKATSLIARPASRTRGERPKKGKGSYRGEAFQRTWEASVA